MAELPAFTIHVHTALLVAFLTRVLILCTISAIYNEECIQNFGRLPSISLKMEYEVDWPRGDDENV